VPVVLVFLRNISILHYGTGFCSRYVMPLSVFNPPPMKRYLKIRWILLGMGLFAIIGLTGMNIFSMYALHQSNINAVADNQRTRVAEFAQATRTRFWTPVENIWRLNMEQLDQEFDSGMPLNAALADILVEAQRDPLYTAIYFAYPDFDACQVGGELYQFDADSRALILLGDNPEFVCDGLGLARTRMKVLLKDYRWNTLTVVDTHRSMIVALVNPRGSQVVGYFLFAINQDYLMQEYFPEQLALSFGDSEQSGMTIWLHDWLRNEVIASNEPDMPYDRNAVQYTQRFNNMLDNWALRVSFNESPAVAASSLTLTRNMMVLGAAVFLLLSSMVILFVISSRERALAERQAGFLANVTHELKTPLAVMQAAGENLADGRVSEPERLKTYGIHIQTEALRLRRMIEKLLDVARNDAGQHLIKPVPVKLSELADLWIQENIMLLRAQKIDPLVELTSENAMVMIDKDSFATIISNLVENAIKYNGGNKFLAIRVKSDVRRVWMEVEDHGLGIPEKSQKLIFEKFYRAEDTLTAKTKGHGLGLSIVKSLVELNGGVISVTSSYRKGSIFSVQFPLLVSQHDTAKQSLISESKVEYAS
jgi:signal transduction histidine kinase